MITAQKLEVRAGARLLMEDVTFRIAAGDKVGLVGRNGAGKTTLTRILAGEGTPADGQVLRTGEVGYLPQDPRVGDPDVIARDRILSARGLAQASYDLVEAEVEMAHEDPKIHERGMKRWARADAELHAGGGYAAESEAAQMAAALGIEERILAQPIGTLSGGQRRRVELARILFSGAEIMLLDEPTNNLDPASREEVLHAIRSYTGAIILVTHDEGAVRALDPDRVLLLPDGDEDLWSEDYADLVSLA